MTLTPREIIRQVAEEFGVDPADFTRRHHCRHNRLVDAKHEAIARVHEAHREMSCRQISRHFGNLDHSTIINALKRLKAGRYSNGEPRRRMANKPVLTRELARTLYLDEGHSITRIAKDFNCRQDLVSAFFDKSEIRRQPGSLQAPPPKVPPHVVASIHHQLDFKRSGYTGAYYRAECEIPPELDLHERRQLARHPRVFVRGHQHGSWLGSPAALCSVA